MSPPVREVGAAEGVELARGGYRVIDVRERSEWDAGHVAGATLLPLAELPQRIGEVVPDPTTPLLVHCAVGERSSVAARWLAAAGYRNVVNLRAPIGAWTVHGGEWADGAAPDRYARQTLLPEIGPDGQRRLTEARVLLVGVGGLGSPVALYLAAAGVGTIGMVDDDMVDESNLGRQVLHGTDRVGVAKVASAAATVRSLNPQVRVTGHEVRLGSQNVEHLVAGHDVVVDGTDRIATRYLLNDAAVAAGIPLVHASIYRWEGQVTTVVPGGPCYRCLYPDPVPRELAAECSVAGVLGVLPGLVGMLQANEVLKLVVGYGEPLSGRLLLVDARGPRFEELRYERTVGCPACAAGAVATPA